MAEVKTKPTTADAVKFLESLEDEQKRMDSLELLKMMKEITGKEPVMWGEAIVGFDQYAITGSKGEVNTWPMIAFSPRKQSLTLYFMPPVYQVFEDLLGNLGKHSASKACLYINKLSDVDMHVLQKIAKKSYRMMKEKEEQT
jgi:hypothetical protein